MSQLTKNDEYIEKVLNGQVKPGALVEAAVTRAYRDREKREYTWNEEAAQRVIYFFENLLRHSKGEWAGKKFLLALWQKFILREIFGWFEADGRRRYQRAYIEIPRKNGKSTIAAGVGLYMFSGDKEPGAEVYSAASNKEQASIIHSEAIAMVKSSEILSRYCKVRNNHISCQRLGSKYVPISSQAAGKHGLNVHGAMVDELHAHKNRDIYDVLDTATGARKSPLIFAITTAGYDKFSICGEQHEIAQSILDGEIQDDSSFCFISTIDEGDSWEDTEAWGKANPNLGVSCYADDLKLGYERAKRTPARENIFKRLRLNVWTEQANRWIPLHEWDRCNLEVVSEDPPTGIPLYCGLDVGSTRDITALVIAWGRNPVHVLPKFWCAEEAQEERTSFDRTLFRNWIDRGLVMETPGNVTDYEPMIDYIRYISPGITELAFDRWGSNDIVQRLEGMGFKTEVQPKASRRRQLVRFGQGYKSMSPACVDFERMILERKLNHGGNPVLRWMMKNVAIMSDPTGAIKPDKRKRSGKIDGIVAAIMATARLLAQPERRSSPSTFQMVAF